MDKITASVEQLKQFDYDGIPTLYEEAMVIYFGSQGMKFDLNTFNIKRRTIQRYVKFVQLRSSMRPDNHQTTLKRLISEFGRSYFFYFAFGRVGVL